MTQPGGTADGPAPDEARSVLGVDIGGSKTTAVRVVGGIVVARATVGSANLQSVSEEAAGRELDRLAAQVGAADVVTVCVGAAGADTESGQARLAALVAARFPRARVRVVHDSEIILPAAGHEHGIAVISGTGSVALGLGVDGSRARAGGWGYLLGDEGSGYAIGRDAIRHVLGRADRGEPADRLTDAVLAAAQAADAPALLEAVYRDPQRARWARLAGVVTALADRDAPSTAILDAAADALATLAATVSGRLGPGLPVVLAGGVLVNEAALSQRVAARCRAAGHIRVEVLTHEPVMGAVRLALGR